MDPAVARKVAELALAATVTEAGTLSMELVLDSVTAAPPAGAACDNVTVQVEEAFDPMLPGLHVTDDTRVAATRLMVAFVVLPP